jgi:hypothetical protein
MNRADPARWAVVAALSLFCGGAWAQPAPAPPAALFGIALGAPLAAIPGARPFKPGWYRVDPPPRPEQGLERAAVEAFADTGVCVIQGAGPAIRDDPDGAKARAAIDALAARISQRYGPAAKADDCSSLVCAPAFWAIDVETGERHYAYRWSPHADAAPGVWEISVFAVARSATVPGYVVQYDSPDVTACRDAENQTGDDNR